MTPGLQEYTETTTNPPYEGTIIDVETNHNYQPICFGSIHGNQLSILYIKDDEPDTWEALTRVINTKLEQLPKPYLAFHATFDQEVISDLLGRPIPFDGDLHVLPHSKDRTHRKLGGKPIPDPLKSRSSQVPTLWGKYLRRKRKFLLERIIKHNRACLLKETYISQQAGWKPISEYALTHHRTITMTPQNKITQQLLQALKQKQIVNIRYQNQKGKETTHDIAVLSLGHQYLTGYCYERNDLRTFNNDRLVSITITNSHISNTQLFG
jgi:hypothetical protein